jgi:hypothetical protein
MIARHACWLVAAAALTMGCSHEYSVELRLVTDAPLDVIISDTEIIVPEGMAVGVRPIPYRDGDRIDDVVEFVPARPGIIGMDPGVEEGIWVFYGEEAGSVSVEVTFDEEYRFDLRAEVVPQ